MNQTKEILDILHFTNIIKQNLKKTQNQIKMALFFDYKLQTPLSDPNFLFFEWHSTFPILAIATYSRNSTGQINLHFEEVINIKSQMIYKKDLQIKK